MGRFRTVSPRKLGQNLEGVGETWIKDARHFCEHTPCPRLPLCVHIIRGGDGGAVFEFVAVFGQ